jgi:hypothetical protein
VLAAAALLVGCVDFDAERTGFCTRNPERCEAGGGGGDGGGAGGDAGADGGTDGGGTDASTPVDAGTGVRVTRLRRYLLADGGRVEVPEDFAAAAPELSVLQGAGWAPVAGVVEGPGRYHFPEAPPGTLLLRLGGRYLVTDVRTLDLSETVLGRPGVAQTDAGLVPAVATVTGLAPAAEADVAGGDFLFLSVPAVGDWGTLEVAERRTLGQTDVVDAGALYGSGTWSRPPVFLPSDALGATLSQTELRDAGVVSGGGFIRYQAVSHTGPVTALVTDGGVMEVQARLEPAPQKEVLFELVRADFNALRTDVYPDAGFVESRFSISPVPGGLSEGWVGYSGFALELQVPDTDPSRLVRRLRYGLPLPAPVGEVGEASALFQVRLRTHDGTATLSTLASVQVRDRVDVLVASAITPRIGPVRGITLDGAPAAEPRLLGAASPLVAWQPPAVGTPSVYLVTVYELLAPTTPGGAARRLAVASFYVDAGQRSFRLPRNFFGAGKTYVLRVAAIQSSAYVPQRPFGLFTAVDYGLADAFTGAISVP